MDHNKQWKSLQELGIETTLLVSWEICMQVKKQQLELDMDWFLVQIVKGIGKSGSKSGKEYVKAVSGHLLI